MDYAAELTTINNRSGRAGGLIALRGSCLCQPHFPNCRTTAGELVMKHLLQAVWGPVLLMVALVSQAAIGQSNHYVQIRDVATIEGVRENPLVGYGMVAGLAGTGDPRQTMFSTQTLGNILLKMGASIPAAAVSGKNVAVVFVTASLPPFAHPGTQIDVTVSSIGDATSLEGGTLLLAPLYAADGQVYAEAQGLVTESGYFAGQRGNTKQVNHPAAGRVSNGGLVERDATPITPEK